MLDYHLFHWANTLAARHDGFEDPLKAYVQASEIVVLLGVAALFLSGSARLRRAAVAAGLTAGVALVLSFGRVALGVHYPSDVFAGAVLGLAAALVLWIRPLRERVDRLADALGRVVSIRTWAPRRSS